MGRRKLEIVRQDDRVVRYNTFKKRNPGVFKKAFELGELCGCE
ncbi:hypothetical protein KIPB_013028, partial [Kipferlia bialata]|eukprot:g13028.t1